MPNVPINLTGGNYQHRSRSLSNQVTENLYPELVDDEKARNKYVLHNFPGTPLFSSGEAGIDRGMFEFQGVLYKVTGTTLYSVASDGTHTEIMSIPGTGRCIFEGISQNLIIVTEGVVYHYIPRYDVSDMIYRTETYDISPESLGSNDIAFGDSGTKFYICNSNADGGVIDAVYQYNLSTAWDITTASYTSKLVNVGGTEAGPHGLIFNDDGTKMYICGNGVGGVSQWTLSTAWDISTASYASKQKTILSEDSAGEAEAISFNDDGTKMYVLGSTNDEIYQYTLSTAWDVSTAAYSYKKLSVTSQDTAPTGMYLNTSGTRVYVVGTTNNTVYQYTLSTAWDISTGSYDSVSYDISSEETTCQGVFFRDNERFMYIVGFANDAVFQYSTLGTVSDSDLETPNSVAHLNNIAIYDGDNQRWCTSNAGDATTINALNYATAESNPDNLNRVYVFNQVLYLMGEKTTELWRNTGVGNPPFDRIEGAIIPIGIAAIHSAANNDNFIYLLADDNRVYQVAGSNKRNVSDIAFSHAIEKYTTVSDAIGLCFEFENQNFYMLSFPTEGKTWCFSESTGKWFKLSTSGGRYAANSHAFAYRKNLIADYRSGKIYELDVDTYDQNGEENIRIRGTGPITGEVLGAPGRPIEMSRFELIMETGVGQAGDPDPKVMLSWSDDGGKTLETEQWHSMGKEGDYLIRLEWFSLGRFEQRNMWVQISADAMSSIFSANADLEVGI